MNKKYIIVGIIMIVFVIMVAITIRDFHYDDTRKNETYKIKRLETDGEFAEYSLENIQIKDLNANLIFLQDIYGTGQDELKVKAGDTYVFDVAFEEKTIEVLEITDDYITISSDGLAPTKNSGGFSLIDTYDSITINKNTGVCLNVQMTDLYDGSVYFFYINQ